MTVQCGVLHDDGCFLCFQREVKHLTEQRDSLEALVQHVQFDVKAKEQILTDTRDLLRLVCASCHYNENTMMGMNEVEGGVHL